MRPASPTIADARRWFEEGAFDPPSDMDPRSAPQDDDLARRARAMRDAFSTSSGEVALQTILDLTVARAPVDHRLGGSEYRQYAQLRLGHNQIAAAIVAYLAHAETLDRSPAHDDTSLDLFGDPDARGFDFSGSYGGDPADGGGDDDIGGGFHVGA